MAHSTILAFYLIATGLTYGFNGDSFELECPDECDCHYFRINWVTDCSESNLTEVPYDELSLSVYILDLNGNNITTLKPFPGDIKMRRLQIANNRLTRVDKDAFKGLEYLIDVDLSGNNISYVDPEAFLDARGLLNVELQDNPLTSVEGPFLASSTLQYLDISYCNLSSINTQFFDNITTLTTVDLSGNPLKTLEPGMFDVLTSLETLKLNDCKLTSISENTFASAINIKYLELSGNQLINTDWPEVLGKLLRLEYLNLRKSGLTSLSEDTFSNCTNLVTLILADNELRDLDVATTLGNSVTHLELLDLSNCNIQGPISGETFTNATRLKTLYLSGNPLVAADLQAALEPLPKLEKLFLSHCGLRDLPDNFNVFDNLLELDISHNPLENVFTKLLAPLEKLEYLNMGYSNLSYIGPDTFAKMTSMKRLVLSGNDLLSLEAGLFGNLTQLTTIELEFCGLKRPLNGLAFFKNLTYMDLREIRLGGNPLVIPASGPIFPKQLSQVSILDLSNCNISSLNIDAFKNTENITDLNLGGNRLRSELGSLSFLERLHHLEKINLGSNNLTTIDPEVFTHNPKLHSLNLLDNPFVCDCKIAEMWDWANMIKGDLDVLVGAKSAEKDIVVKGNKKKKNLYCHYNETQLRNMTTMVNKTVPGRRPFAKPRELTFANRTWAKYVRESGCEPVVKILRPVAYVGEIYDYNQATHISTGVTIVAVMALGLGVASVLMTIKLFRRKNVVDADTETNRKVR
nr:insulin-like growth factor-binding protein complex acid labile subunit [Helicoverpa armigera]XP_021196547.2 insulin-like growth factor-binding protein complex acid labile subunit [Helicoverpa armigera]XP_049692311.1 insulin-like growth factor-binding protein complex acid labile subunit [Helicoverpa armigera]XP_049692312.1 insulin-like growth factor-binding protein complex acid labile subunit [Helicoverpa armigera]